MSIQKSRGGSRKQLVAVLLQQGKFAEAKKHLLKIVRAEPGSVEAHFALGNIFQHDGAVSDATRHYEQVVGLSPNHVGAWFQLGNMHYAQRDYECALECFRKAWILEPNLTDALMNMGASLVGAGRVDEALHAYHQVLQTRPADPVIHYNIGEALLSQSRYKEASGSYQRALQFKEAFPAVHVALGRCFQALGQHEKALACHERALRIDPGFFQAYHNSAICLYSDLDLSAAEQAFRMAAQLAPGNGITECYYGIVLAQQGKEDEAAPVWERARAHAPIAAHIIDSYHYAKTCDYPVRYFSTTARTLEFALGAAPSAGLVLEFGVYFGTSITVIANNTDRIVHGFDSFEGIPEGWDIGDTWGYDAVEEKGAYSTGGTIPEVPPNVRFHVGTFEKTLPVFTAEHPEDVSFINIDCDLHSSTKTVFDHLGGRIKAGTVIVFDEYFCFSGWREHEYRAFQEFLKESGLTYEYLAFGLFTGQAVVRIKDQRG